MTHFPAARTSLATSLVVLAWSIATRPLSAAATALVEGAEPRVQLRPVPVRARRALSR